MMTRTQTLAAALAVASPALATTQTINNVLSNGTVAVQMTSSDPTTFDAPKLSGPANDTTYDWWYFDAASTTSNASVALVFYNGGPDGFIEGYNGGPLMVTVDGTFANGTAFNVDGVGASQAVFEYGEDGISADFKDSGFSFTGTGLTKSGTTYVISIDSPEAGLKGTVTLNSLAPAHYPCNLNEEGAYMAVLPHVGWANAVPDAKASVELTFTSDNTTISFTEGVGYHDKNWGDRTFIDVVEQWYWGHAHFGPYSVVWFDALDLASTEYFSGYVALDGQVLEASCASQAVVVRPWGVNATYPPTLGSGAPQGLDIRFTVGNGTTVVANVTTGSSILASTGYSRNVGSVQGGIEGSEPYSGRALFEQFALIV